MKNPKFSIIIPTRNRKDLLQLAIQSVLNQNYENFEIIVHDNNSSDGTKTMMAQFKNKKLRYYRSTKDLSMHENWNKAFTYVTGDYFLRLDDDNMFCFDLLSKYASEINRHDFDVIIGYPITIINKNSFKLYFDLGTTREINMCQWLLLDLKTLTDSNYVAYNMNLIKKVFPDNIIYETSVPDRYMNLEIMNKYTKFKVKIGLITDIVGVTRYDYERKSIDNNKLEQINLNKIFDNENVENIVKNKDCRGLNFTTHLLLNIIYFSKNRQNEEIMNFIDKNIYSKNHYDTVVQINHLNSQTELRLNKNYKTIFSIFKSLLIHPNSYLYGQPAYKFMFNILVSGIAKIAKKSFLIDSEINRAECDEILNTVFKRKYIELPKNVRSQNGNVNNLISPFSSN